MRSALATAGILAAGCMVAGCAARTTHIVHSAKQETAPAGKPRKVVVLAKVSEPDVRRQLESDLAASLAKKGVPAVAASEVLSEEDLADTSRLVARADELGVDALVRLQPGAPRTEVRNQPSVSVGVGGGWGPAFVGASVPLAGGASAERWIGLAVEYFRREASGPQWTAQLDVNLQTSLPEMSRQVAGLITERMDHDGVL